MTFYLVSALIIALGCVVIIADEARRQRARRNTGATLFEALVAYVADGGDVDDVIAFEVQRHPSGASGVRLVTGADVVDGATALTEAGL